MSGSSLVIYMKQSLFSSLRMSEIQLWTITFQSALLFAHIRFLLATTVLPRFKLLKRQGGEQGLLTYLTDFAQQPYKTTGLGQQLVAQGRSRAQQHQQAFLTEHAQHRTTLSVSTFITSQIPMSSQAYSVTLTSKNVWPASTTLSSSRKHGICTNLVHRRDREKNRQ